MPFLSHGIWDGKIWSKEHQKRIKQAKAEDVAAGRRACFSCGEEGTHTENCRRITKKDDAASRRVCPSCGKKGTHAEGCRVIKGTGGQRTTQKRR